MGATGGKRILADFKDAIVPDTRTSHDFVRELESGKYDHLKDQPVVTYCTGGVRCEVLSAMMIQARLPRGLPNGRRNCPLRRKVWGCWPVGGLTLRFDNRKAVTFSSSPAVIGRCVLCEQPSARMQNCSSPECHLESVVCESCSTEEFWCEEDRDRAELSA